MCRERKVGFTQGFHRFISYLWTKMQAYAIKRKYTLYVLCMLLLCLLLIASLAVSVFWGSNLSQLLVSVEPKLEPAVYLLRGIINLDAVLKMGEAVGICSFLIAWVYASLDKKELGFRYSELLVELYPGYHRFVLLHLVAFLVCIWMTKTEKLEAAVLSLTIVLAESVLQWNTLKNLILFSEKRMKIALDRWNWLIDENSQKPNDELLVTINNIADALIFDVNSCYENMLQILSRAIAKYIDSCPKLFDKEEEYVRTLWEISRIWDRVLSGKSQSDRELLLVGLLRHSIRNFSRGNVLCVGYLLWFYNTLIEQGITNDAALA